MSPPINRKRRRTDHGWRAHEGLIVWVALGIIALVLIAGYRDVRDQASASAALANANTTLIARLATDEFVLSQQQLHICLPTKDGQIIYTKEPGGILAISVTSCPKRPSKHP